MLNEIRKKIEKELIKFIRRVDKLYCFKGLSPLLSKSIKEFTLRKGKRVRPVLFVIGYLGFCRKAAPHLYTSAISLELFHDFMLVHDDIIDKSDTRRGRPSMHAMLNSHLKRFRNIKFNGQDLTIVIGDVMYALGILAFLSIKENMERKEKALKKFIEAAVYTGSGEFIELLYGIKGIENITKSDILKIYDYKTAYYSFAIPLVTGAILAGAKDNQIKKLYEYGIFMGRAFQIKDDIIGMFGSEKKIGKPLLTDLQESKKTLMIWYGFRNSNAKDKSVIKIILSKEKVTRDDLLKMREIIISSGALKFAKNEISLLIKKAQRLISQSKMNLKYKTILNEYFKQLLSL